MRNVGLKLHFVGHKLDILSTNFNTNIKHNFHKEKCPSKLTRIYFFLKKIDFCLWKIEWSCLLKSFSRKSGWQFSYKYLIIYIYFFCAFPSFFHICCFISFYLRGTYEQSFKLGKKPRTFILKKFATVEKWRIFFQLSNTLHDIQYWKMLSISAPLPPTFSISCCIRHPSFG
jgi:hypothetical protein